MKHVQNHQKVSAIVKRFDEYVSDVREAMAEAGGFSVHCNVQMDGSVDGIDIFPVLAAYYDVKEVTSIHSDGTEYNTIWIGYRI